MESKEGCAVLTELRIRNFKTFADSSVRLTPVTLVLGANGVGKSNLFDALRFLKYVGEGRSVRDAIEGHLSPGTGGVPVTGIRGGSAEITRFGSDPPEFELSVSMTIEKERIDYSVRVDARAFRVVREELRSNRHRGTYVFTTHPETGPLEQERDSPVLLARFFKETRGLNPRREFSPHEFILSQFKERRAESRHNEEVAEKARAELASIQPLELRPEAIRQYSPLGLFELGEHGENLGAVVWELATAAEFEEEEVERGGDHAQRPESALSRLNSVNAWLSELTPKAVTGLAFESAPTGEVIFALVEDPPGRQISARSLSDGTLRFAAFALALLGSGGRRTLVVEELENGINPSRLNLLLRMIEDTATGTPGIQVIASTHSPVVLNQASPGLREGVIVIGWDSDRNASSVVRLEDLPDLDEISLGMSLGDLQTEGWLQFAADT